MPSPFIPDGYTREALILAGDSHPEAYISYRPLLAAERRRLALQTVRLNGRGAHGREAAARLMAEALASRIVSWDLFDERGKLLDITAESLLALDPALYEQIHTKITEFEDEEATAKNC